MTNKAKKIYINRLKSFAWRLGGMTFVAVATYLLDIGNIFQVDWQALSNFAVMTVLGLAVGEITKVMNS
jgi:hypothetical protein